MLYPAASLFLSYQHVFYIGLWYYLRIGSCDMLIDCGVGSVSNYSLYLMQKHRTQCTLTPAPNIPLTNDITPHFELLPYLYPPPTNTTPIFSHTHSSPSHSHSNWPVDPFAYSFEYPRISTA